jgi:predicted TIM-barrel fold metal-dependent hydrolase
MEAEERRRESEEERREAEERRKEAEERRKEAEERRKNELHELQKKAMQLDIQIKKTQLADMLNKL